MSTILTINGTAVSNKRLVIDKLHLKLKGVDQLVFSVRGGSLPGRPDPYTGQAVTLTVGGTLRFSGDVVSCNPHETALGYFVQYSCLGLRNRGDWCALTDSNTGTDTAQYNLQPDNPNYIAARAGRNVGQILTDILTMTDNATALDGWGIGRYTWSGLPAVPTLPTLTAADLALLTLVPPHEVAVSGERLLTAIDGFLSNDAPNISMRVEADGTLRFYDHRTFTATTLTADTDPIDVPVLSHDTGECFSRVRVRGQPLTEGVLVTWSAGSLQEDFGYTDPKTGVTYTNAQAKTNWSPSVWTSPGGTVTGTCNTSTETTTTVDITSSNNADTWPANYFDQSSTGAQGVIYLVSSTAGGLITQTVTRKIVANTALTAGGHSTVTFDYPIPTTNYDTFTIHYNQSPLAMVYRKYKVVNAAIGAAMTQMFMYPVPWVSSAGNLAQLVSFPTTSIVSTTGTEEPLQATYDASTGHVYLFKPSALVFGGGSTTTVPADIRALLAVNKGPNEVYAPVNGPYGTANYEGTFFTVDLASNTARAKTLTVTVSDWRDPNSGLQLQAYAQDLLDSVKDTVYEGSIAYNDLYTPALTFGLAVNVTGSSYTTGWEAPLTSFTGHPGLPVVEVEVEWPQDGGALYRTTMHCSNRRAHYSASEFLRPARSFQPLGIDTGGSVLNLGMSGLNADPYSQDITGQQQGLLSQGPASGLSDSQTGGGDSPSYADLGIDPAGSGGGPQGQARDRGTVDDRIDRAHDSGKNVDDRIARGRNEIDSRGDRHQAGVDRARQDRQDEIKRAQANNVDDRIKRAKVRNFDQAWEQGE